MKKIYCKVIPVGMSTKKIMRELQIIEREHDCQGMQKIS